MSAFIDEDAQWTTLDQCRAIEMELTGARRGFRRKSRRQLRRIASRSPWEMAVETGWVREETK